MGKRNGKITPSDWDGNGATNPYVNPIPEYGVLNSIGEEDNGYSFDEYDDDKDDYDPFVREEATMRPESRVRAYAYPEGDSGAEYTGPDELTKYPQNDLRPGFEAPFEPSSDLRPGFEAPLELPSDLRPVSTGPAPMGPEHAGARQAMAASYNSLSERELPIDDETLCNMYDAAMIERDLGDD